MVVAPKHPKMLILVGKPMVVGYHHCTVWQQLESMIFPTPFPCLVAICFLKFQGTGTPWKIHILKPKSWRWMVENGFHLFFVILRFLFQDYRGFLGSYMKRFPSWFLFLWFLGSYMSIFRCVIGMTPLWVHPFPPTLGEKLVTTRMTWKIYRLHTKNPTDLCFWRSTPQKQGLNSIQNRWSFGF